MTDRVTLRPGDYVSTKGMTEDQYHAVARAFMAAGAEEGEYGLYGYGVCDFFGWANDPEELQCDRPCALHGRHLTIDQVLNATNAGAKNADPIATLRQARKARDEAERAYQQALEDVRDALGVEFYLTDVGTDAPLVDGEDMSDPANWREGDVLEFTSETAGFYTKGKLYKIVGYGRPEDDFQIEDDQDDEHYWDSAPLADNFKFHHRP